MGMIVKLGTDVDATAVAAQTAVAINASPFLPNRTAIATFSNMGVTGSGVAKIQGSNDSGTTWTDLLTQSGVTNTIPRSEVTLYASMRLNITTGFSAGKLSAHLTGVQ